MKRLLIDIKKLDPAVVELLRSSYPDGYGDEDIISFKNGNGEIVNAVELRTDDIFYLVKISTSTSHFIANEEEESQNASQEEHTEDSEMTDLDLDLEEELEEDSDQDA